MSNEFDFDELLNEVEKISDGVKTSDPVEEVDVSADDLLAELADGPVNTVNTVSTVETMETTAPAIEPDAMEKAVQAGLGTRNKAKANVPEYSDEFIDVIDATRRYIKDSFDIAQQMRELKEEQKVIREKAKEEGVSVTNTDKAIKELVKELKETADESKGIEDTKRFIKSEDDLYAGVVEIAG